MSKNDSFSDFKKTLSVTASALLNPKGISDTILSSSGQYEALLKDTLASDSIRGNTLAKFKDRKLKLHSHGENSFQDIYSARNGASYFENGYIDKRSSFRILSYLNDDLLNDIAVDNGKETNSKKLIKGSESSNQKSQLLPPDKPTLFDGFKATLTTDLKNNTPMNQITGDSPTMQLEFGNNDDQHDNTGFVLPEELEPLDIKHSTSIDTLTTSFKSILNTIDGLDIKKQNTAYEIEELDSKLQHLKVRRDLMFNRVVDIEESQFGLENKLTLIRDRIEELKSMGIQPTDLRSSESENTSSNFKNIDEVSTPLHSPIKPSLRRTESGFSDDFPETIDTSVRDDLSPQKNNSTDPLHSFFQPRNKKYRKTASTMQQYYPVGTKINTLSRCHNSSISTVDFDVPFGLLCTSGIDDHVVKVWDAAKYKEIGLLEGHTADITCMEMDKDYNMVITGSRDATLKLWNIGMSALDYTSQDTDEDFDVGNIRPSSCVHSFESHVNGVSAISINSNTMVSGSEDRTIRVWDLHTGHCIETLDLNFSSITKVISSDQGFTSNNSGILQSAMPTTTPITGDLQSYDVALATGTCDGIVRLWDLRSGEVVRTLTGHKDAITTLKFDTTNIITGSLDKSVKIWDLRMGTLSDSFTFESPVLSVDFDAEKIVIANNESSVKIFDRTTRKHLYYREDSQNSLVKTIRYQNGYVVEGRSDGDVNVWAV